MLAFWISGVLALAAAAPATHEQTATGGATTARVTWTGEFPEAADLHVTIDRAGQRLHDAPAPAELAPGGDDTAPVVRVLDLGGDPEREVLVEGYTGGAHCCTVGLVYRFAGDHYELLRHDFGNIGYRLTDLDGDGPPEFFTRDDFSYAFGAYVESVSPLQVIALRDGELADVTTSFRSLVRADAKRLGRRFRRMSRGRDNVRPVLAAYAAELHRLGQHRQARRVVDRALRRGLLKRRRSFEFGPFGKAYVLRLNRMLREGGYL
jgi:hypothetical protein